MNINYSFIIPHHNTPDLLQRCVDSIPKRDDIEIIVVDDNSSEDKKAAISRSDVRILYLDENKSKGAGHARNEGLAIAKGKWLMFADCDDYYKPQFIEVLDKYKDNERIDVVYFNFDYIDATTGMPVLAKKQLQETIMHFDGSTNNYNYLRYNNFTPWAKMVRRNYSEKYGMYFEEVPNGNDILYSFMVAFNSENFVVEPKPLYVYLKQKSSIVNKTPSYTSIKSKINHFAKVNFFLKSIGVKGTRKPVWYMIMQLFIKSSSRLTLQAVFSILINYSCFLKERQEWVRIINTHRV